MGGRGRRAYSVRRSCEHGPRSFRRDRGHSDGDAQRERKKRTMSIQLPDPIERYVQIANSGTPEAATECFAPDATVYDEGRTYEGVAAIENWMAATKKKYAPPLPPPQLPHPAAQ